MKWERQAWDAGKLIVAGVDEAGRGAWAGPLVAAAVIMPRDPVHRARLSRAITRAGTEIRDSKLLTAEHRERIWTIVQNLDVRHAVCEIPASQIDAVGLGVANRLALAQAAAALSPTPEHVLVDAFLLNDLPCSHEAIIHGDNLSQAIALASIVAKAHRDARMRVLHDSYPSYDFATHKGYGTAAHARALSLHGPSPHHRRSFAPVDRFLSRVEEQD